jgi:Holliday junction DNA helicase RuvA
MIATLTGTIAEKLSEQVVVDVAGVGYGVLFSAEENSRLVVGDSAKVYIYEHIRDNAHDLYGFCDLASKRLFELLLEVNGVGPKMALNILSIASVDNVRAAIAGGETKMIQQANGVGKRVAERIVVDLKDKVGLVGVDISATGLLIGDTIGSQDEAVQGLVSLGYSVQDAAKALHAVDESLSTEDRIKAALKAGA